MSSTSSGPSSPADCVFTHLIKLNDPMGLFSPSDCDALGKAIDDTLMPLTFPPLETLPCHASDCQNSGKLPCARCKLVSYCSQKCEKRHRSVHKQSTSVFSGSFFPDTGFQDDDNPELCSSGSPSEETASSLFALDSMEIFLSIDQLDLDLDTCLRQTSSTSKTTKEMRLEVSLWHLLVGRPLKFRRLLSEPGFALPLASGDLRDVIRTVNALGPGFTGRLHILLNDTSKAIVSRNIVLLLILGAMPNEAVAADVALHFWYSVFLPEEYRLRILALLLLILQQHVDDCKAGEPLSVALGRRAKLTCLVPREITEHLLYAAGPTCSTVRARDEYGRVGATPARLDARKHALAGVKSCHRLALEAFWRSGVVLPFSVVSDHYTAPNASLFSPCSGTLLKNHVENPLASWDPDDIVKAGRAHGAQPEDIYGCLYFFLSDQLRAFAERIRDLDVTFHMFSTSAHTLARGIAGGEYAKYGLTHSVRFDRIDLGHTLADARCMRDVLTSWMPLLAGGDTATILGTFADWTDVQKEGSVMGVESTVVAPIYGKLVRLGRLSPGTTLESAMTTETRSLDAAYDNSKAFSKYLKSIGFTELLREGTLGLKRRPRHKILSHRVKMPIDAKSSELPHMPDDETWYRYVRLARVPFTARYVELARTEAWELKRSIAF